MRLIQETVDSVTGSPLFCTAVYVELLITSFWWKKSTVLQQNSLKELIGKMSSANPHFIRFQYFFYNCIVMLITRWVKMYAFWVKMYALICVTLLSKLYGWRIVFFLQNGNVFQGMYWILFQLPQQLTYESNSKKAVKIGLLLPINQYWFINRWKNPP